MKLTRLFRAMLAATLAALTLFSAVTAFAETAADTQTEQPTLKLTYVPKYGSSKNVKGKVVLKGGKLKAKDYRVTLFLQVEQGGEYWVKPTWAKPYVKLKSSGSFSLDYTTGGTDELAVTLHIMLIPADYTPSDFQDTRSHAIDYVRVERTADGKNTVTE